MSRSAARKSALFSLLVSAVAGVMVLALRFAIAPVEPDRMPCELVPAGGAVVSDTQSASAETAPAPAQTRRTAEDDPAASAGTPGGRGAPDSISVRGRVGGAARGEALVSFFELRGPRAVGGAHRALTDGAGRFVCRGLSPGSFELVVTRRGVVELAQEVSLHADTDLGELVLGARSNASPADDSRFRILGQVRDAATGAPLAAVRLRWGERPETSSGRDGRFVLAGTAALSSRTDGVLVASHPEYATRRVAVPGGSELGQQRIEISLDRIEARPGWISDRDGAPIAGAQVAVFVGGLPYALPSETALSDERGAFQLGLRHGPTTEAGRPRELYVTHADFAPARLRVPGGDASLHIALDEGATLVGRVTDADGVAAAGARVSLEGADAERTTESAADGSFRIELLEPSVYELVVVAEGFAEPAPRRCALVPGEQRCDVALVAGVELDGRVVDERGRAVPSARVRVLGGASSTDANAEGEFRLERLTPDAAHEVEVSAAGHVTTLFRLDARAPEPVTLTVPRAASLVAFAFDRGSGFAVTDGHLLLRRSDALEAGASPTPLVRSGAAGEFRADDLTPGAYTLEVQAEGYTPAVADVWLSAGRAARVEIALDSGVRVAGRLVDGLGRGLAGARLMWTPLDVDSRPRVVATVDGGAFSATGFVPGSWSVAVAHPDCAFVPPRRIDVAAGAVELVIELDPGDVAMQMAAPDVPTPTGLGAAGSIEAR